MNCCHIIEDAFSDLVCLFVSQINFEHEKKKKEKKKGPTLCCYFLKDSYHFSAPLLLDSGGSYFSMSG